MKKQKNRAVLIGRAAMSEKSLQRPGIEPGPPAWQARILPLNQRCLVIIIHL